MAAAAAFRRLNSALIIPSAPSDSHHILHLCAEGHLTAALATLYSLKSSPLAAVYAALFQAFARRRLLPLGQSLHRHMLLSAHHPNNLYLSNHLINMYSKCARLDIAQRLFDTMPHRNLVSWTALLTGYSQLTFPDDCFRVFSAMLRHYLPSDYALAAVLSCTDSPHTTYTRGRQVHAVACKTSLDANVFVGNALITMYSSCSGYEDDGWYVFLSMPIRNLITWNSMIAGLLLNRYPTQATNLFSYMHHNSLEFDRATLLSTIPACLSLRQCQQLHCLIFKTCFACDAGVATSLVKAYSGIGGDALDCYRVFYEVREHDILSWTGFITSCAERDPDEAIVLFCRLRQEGLVPDSYTFSIAVKACANFATDRHCLALHSLIVKSGLEDNMVLSNVLIHAYARCSTIKSAERVFKQMKVRDEVSWNSMIKAYAAHGQGREALGAFRCMDVPPDSATFVGVLMACSHGGLVNEGRNIFKAMSNVYGIPPQLDHFACMVDILGRAGDLLAAENLVYQMPMEPDYAVWSALLGACRKHKDVKIGRKAAQKLMELEPHNSFGYVMMSNIYCAMGSLSDAALARKEMKDNGVKKDPGLSWIEIGNCVHEFSAGGRRHPQREAICVELKLLANKVKEMGYVADTRLLSQETEEKHKEERLLLHSEKLALAFGLMNTSTSQACIRIIKNIRICEDCHSFITLASKCVTKEIVVRDPNRFHHFIDGTCSCGDYW